MTVLQTDMSLRQETSSTASRKCPTIKALGADLLFYCIFGLAWPRVRCWSLRDRHCRFTSMVLTCRRRRRNTNRLRCRIPACPGGARTGNENKARGLRQAEQGACPAMKVFLTCIVLALAFAATTVSADAKGCLKGAVVGGVAGHVAGHHGVLGAAAGCVIGHHEANKTDKAQQNQAPNQ